MKNEIFWKFHIKSEFFLKAIVGFFFFQVKSTSDLSRTMVWGCRDDACFSLEGNLKNVYIPSYIVVKQKKLLESRLLFLSLLQKLGNQIWSERMWGYLYSLIMP